MQSTLEHYFRGEESYIWTRMSLYSIRYKEIYCSNVDTFKEMYMSYLLNFSIGSTSALHGTYW
jgi:hypothetical protein